MTKTTPQVDPRPALPDMDQPVPRPRKQRDDRGIGVPPQRLIDHAQQVMANVPPIPDLGPDVSGGRPAGTVDAFIDAVESQITAGHTARYNEAAAALFGIGVRNDAERSAVLDALDALRSRMQDESLDSLRTKVAVVAAGTADDKATVIVDLIRSALVAPCPAWCVEVHGDEGNHGFGAMHASAPVTVTQECGNSGLVPTAVVEVRAFRMDDQGRPGRAVVDVKKVSEYAELAPDTATRLVEAVLSVNALVVEDRAVVAGGA